MEIMLERASTCVCACVRVSTSKKDSVRECVSKRECKCERVNQRERWLEALLVTWSN